MAVHVILHLVKLFLDWVWLIPQNAISWHTGHCITLLTKLPLLEANSYWAISSRQGFHFLVVQIGDWNVYIQQLGLQDPFSY